MPPFARLRRPPRKITSEMQRAAEVLFLGTSSGGGPSRNRNCSSLSLTQHGRTSLVDAADGTFSQMLRFGLKPSAIDNVFVTHMHADHILGLPAVLIKTLPGFDVTPEQQARFEARDPSLKPSVHVFGPSGLRRFLRTAFELTQVQLGGMYAVHELLSPGDTPTSCATADRHLNEAPGRDLRPDQDGLWLNLLDQPASTSTARSSSLQVSAGSILHRVPTVGYSFSFPPSARPLPSTYAPALKAHGLPMSLLGGLIQTGQPISLPDGTKLTHPGWLEGPRIAVLGDTSDASGMASLAQDVDLLIHEATNAYLPKPADDPANFVEKAEAARIKSAGRGHSTPDVAGAFARSVNARNLALNHFSTMFFRNEQVEAVAEQARTAFQHDGRGGGRVLHARDGLRLLVEAGGSVSIVPESDR